MKAPTHVFFSVDEIAKRYGLARRRVLALVRSRKLRASAHGRNLYVERSELVLFERRHTKALRAQRDAAASRLEWIRKNPLPTAAEAHRQRVVPVFQRGGQSSFVRYFGEEIESVTEAARRWGITRGRVLQLLYQGRIPAYRAGRNGPWMIPANAKKPAERQRGRPRRQLGPKSS